MSKKGRLNQILAVEKGLKNKTYADLTRLHKTAQKRELYDGRTGLYKPVDEEGERFPAEGQKVQLRSQDVLEEMRDLRSEYFDLVLQKDETNLTALADVSVDGEVLVSQVPVTYLLFLEKELKDVETFVSAMPTLDAAEEWTMDNAQGSWRSEAVETAKTKKVLRSHVLYEATPEHPAQCQAYNEDVVTGNWTRTKYSNALTAPAKKELLRKTRVLQRAVKTAREEANSTMVADSKPAAKAIFNFLLD